MVKINYIHQALLGEKKYMTLKFNYLAPKWITQHFLKPAQYTFKHCKKKYLSVLKREE